MPFTPDQPYPKTPGNPIMAKDWNDAITELQRLDTAKVNRAGVDAIAGPLTIANALAVGTATAAAAGTRLHVVDTVSPVVARLQSTASFGAARLEMWSDPRGGTNEWRPGYIESFDNGTFTGGLRLVTNGTGAAAKQGAVEALRVVNGQTGFGAVDPAFRIDALGPIRVRQFGGVPPGTWLSGSTNANRAFVGLLNDNVVGIQGAVAGWNLMMDVNTGNVGVRSVPGTSSLTVAGNAYVTGNMGVGHDAPTVRVDTLGRLRSRQNAGETAGLWLFQTTPNADRGFVGMNGDNTLGLWGSSAGWGLTLDTTNGNVNVPGDFTASSVWSGNVHVEVNQTGQLSTVADWSQIGSMSVAFSLDVARPVWFNLVLPGVRIQTSGAAAGTYTVGFRLILDNVTTIVENIPFLNTTIFQAQTITLSRLLTVAAGPHTVRADWFSRAGVTLFCCEGGVGAGGNRVLQVIEL